MPVAVVEPRVEAPFEVALRIEERAELERVPARLGLDADRPCLVLVGGADGLGPGDLDALARLFTDVLAPLAATLGAVVVDGGTDTGVMRLMGRALAAAGRPFPLVGVVPVALATGLEPNHSHFVLVPGTVWGDETPWLAAVATTLAGAQESATLLLNGGEISWADVEASVAAGRPVVAVAGSGRTADALAAAVRGIPGDQRGAGLAASGLVYVADLADRREIERLLLDLLRS